MRMVWRLMGRGLLLLTVASCASGVKFRHVNPPLTPTRTESGRIFCSRPSAFGAALRPDVRLNGETVGEAVSWGYFSVDRPPGHYEVVTSTEVDRTLTFVLEPGQTRFVCFSTSIGFFVGHVYGELVDPEVGRSDIQECKYTGGEPPP